MAGQKTELTLEILARVQQSITDLNAVKESIRQLDQSTGTAAMTWQSAEDGLRKMGTAATVVFGSLSAAAGLSVTKFAEYEQAVVNVQNITEMSDASMQGWVSTIGELPPTLGSSTDLMRGLYMTISSGITEPAAAMEVLVTSAKGAKGNLAELVPTLSGLTSVLNAYGLEAEDSTAVMDAMVKTVDLGKLTFSELSNSIGQGISVASSAGVSYQELLAVIATLTLNGLDASEAMTSVRNILMVALKPTDQVREGMAKLGVDISAAAMAEKGLAAWMADAAAKTQDNAEMTALLFPNIRALNGALKLTSEEGGEKYRQVLNDIENSQGKTERNFVRMSATFKAGWDAMVVELNGVRREFGDTIAQGLTPYVAKISEAARAMAAMSPEARQSIVDAGAYTMALSGIVIVLPRVIAGVRALAAANAATTIAVQGGTVALGAWGVALAAAYVAGKGIEAWLNNMNQLTSEYARGLEQSTAEQTRWYAILRESGADIDAMLANYSELTDSQVDLETAFRLSARGIGEGAWAYAYMRDEIALTGSSTKELAKDLDLWQAVLDHNGLVIASTGDKYGDLKTAMDLAAQGLGPHAAAYQQMTQLLEKTNGKRERVIQLMAAEAQQTAAMNRASEESARLMDELSGAQDRVTAALAEARDGMTGDERIRLLAELADLETQEQTLTSAIKAQKNPTEESRLGLARLKDDTAKLKKELGETSKKAKDIISDFTGWMRATVAAGAAATSFGLVTGDLVTGQAALQRGLESVVTQQVATGRAADVLTGLMDEQTRSGANLQKAWGDAGITVGDFGGALVASGHNIDEVVGKLNGAGLSASNMRLSMDDARLIAGELGIAFGGPGGLAQALIEAANSGMDLETWLKNKLPPATDTAGRALLELQGQLLGVFSGGIRDLLGGQVEDLGDFLGDLFTDMGGNLASAMGEAFVAGLDTGDWSGLGALFGGEAEGVSMADRVSGIASGLGMVYAATQQANRTMAALGGLMGGASAGAQIGFMVSGGNPLGAGVGAVIGAIVGGIVAYMASGTESPETQAALGFDAGGYYASSASRGHQGMGAEEHRLYQQKLVSAYQQLKLGYFDLVAILDDPALFDLVGAMPEFDSSGWVGMSAQELAQWLTESFLPSEFEDTFHDALWAGLSSRGVTSATFQRLYAELEQISGTQRLEGMETYLRAVVGGAELIAAMDWDAVMASATETPREAFVRTLSAGLQDIDVQLAQFGQLTLLEQADTALGIYERGQQALSAMVQNLAQLEQLSDAIARSIGQQVEGLRLGGMTEYQQATYVGGQIGDIFAQLQAGGLDASAVSQLTGDAQNYISMLTQLMGGDLDRRLPDVLATVFGNQDWLAEMGLDIGAGSDMTGREFMIALLESLNETAQGAIEEQVDETRLLQEEYLARMEAVNASLTNFQSGVDVVPALLEGLGDPLTDLSAKSAEAAGSIAELAAAAREAIAALAALTTGSSSLAPLVRLIRSVVYAS
jgi:TP901 family phage tail tape measure protein